MSDEGYVEQRSISGALLGVVAVALLAAVGGLVWCYGLQNHLAAVEQKIAAADQKNTELSQKLEATNARLRATSETLGPERRHDAEADRAADAEHHCVAEGGAGEAGAGAGRRLRSRSAQSRPTLRV